MIEGPKTAQKRQFNGRPKQEAVEETFFAKIIHALRMHNTRTVKFITEAHFELKRSVIGGANVGNQLSLQQEIYKEDKQYTQADFNRSKFLTTVPGNKFVKPFLKQPDNNSRVVIDNGRFAWDNCHGIPCELPPYGRIEYKQRSRQDTSIIATWKDDISIVKKLILDVQAIMEICLREAIKLKQVMHKVFFPDVLERLEELSKEGTNENDLAEYFQEYESFCESNELTKRLPAIPKSTETSHYFNRDYSFDFYTQSITLSQDGRCKSLSEVLETFAEACRDLAIKMVILYTYNNDIIEQNLMIITIKYNKLQINTHI